MRGAGLDARACRPWRRLRGLSAPLLLLRSNSPPEDILGQRKQGNARSAELMPRGPEE